MDNIDNSDFIEIYNRNINAIYQICFMYMRNHHDAEDAVQTTFVKLMKKNVCFESLEHEKAWLIVTASNTCKNNLKYWFKSKVSHLIDDVAQEVKNDCTLEMILQMPEKYKLVFYLYYYQGYKIKEISSILKINESTIKSLLRRGRDCLRKIIKEDYE